MLNDLQNSQTHIGQCYGSAKQRKCEHSTPEFCDAALVLQLRFCEEATVAILSKHWQGPLHVAEDLKQQPTYEPFIPSDLFELVPLASVI